MAETSIVMRSKTLDESFNIFFVGVPPQADRCRPGAIGPVVPWDGSVRPYPGWGGLGTLRLSVFEAVFTRRTPWQ